MSEEVKDLYSNVNNILKNINVEEIDPEAIDYRKLQDGYYLCSFKFELTTSKKSGNLQIKASMNTEENGIEVNEDGDLVEIPKTKNTKLWKYYPLTDEDSIKKAIKDMLKFEDEDGQPILEKEDFETLEKIELACGALEELQLFVNVSNYTKKDGEEGTNYNLITWKRAEKLGLLGDEE